ncbi:hypothetical protein GI364_08590 [Alicyclobacillus sp. SO9]|nr:hypothetical protein GI364_08590 [Alicyclobacillus sp. SO9]
MGGGDGEFGYGDGPEPVVPTTSRGGPMQVDALSHLWVGTMVLGVWLGMKYGHLRAGLITSGSLIGFALFYSLFVLGWHLKSEVQSDDNEHHPHALRVKRLFSLCVREPASGCRPCLSFQPLHPMHVPWVSFAERDR